jgi:hypothetical protein
MNVSSAELRVRGCYKTSGQPSQVLFKLPEDSFDAVWFGAELLPGGICFNSLGVPVDVTALNIAQLTLSVAGTSAAFNATATGGLGATLLFV